jgi:hypothetical protein
LPKLASQERKTFYQSATSAPSESVLGVAGFVQRKERSRLSPRHLRFTILLKEEHKIFSDDEENTEL